MHARTSQSHALQIDAPLSAALVPARHCRRDPRVQSVMVEVNRRL
ncbi:hypothetical protein [Thioalkalivibrio sp.]